MISPRLLLVDDDRHFTENMSWLLSRKGYAVSAVNSGESALQILEKQEFDVVILDQCMPSLGGIPTLGEMKKKWPYLEVIILTGAASTGFAIRGLELGAYYYATKPIKLSDLEARIREAFEHKLSLQ